MQDVGVWIYDISRAGAGQTLLIGGADMYHAPDVGVCTHIHNPSSILINFQRL